MTDRKAMADRRAIERKKDRHADRNRGRKPFAGVDGEGGNIPDGKGNVTHEYLLLRAGEHVLETGEVLTSAECLAFLCDLPNDVIYVAFFFDYDVTMMLRDVPPERLARLLDTDCRRIPGKPCSSFAVDWNEFQFDYLPGKEFKVRRRIGREPVTRKLLYSPWVIINDTGSFFQTSFVKALTGWMADGADEHGNMVASKMGPVIARIAEGKEQRSEFGAVTQDERQYNHLECVLLARMMEKFREMCDRVGVRPHKWQGPGNLVSAVMKAEGVPRNSDIPLYETLPDLVRMANDGYYGGRFEVSRYGDIEGPVFQYDINSAYADTYRNLPCLVHGNWAATTSLPAREDTYVGRVRFRHKSRPNFGCLPVRAKRDGALLFPMEGVGTYWSPELDVARDWCELEWLGGYVYTSDCDCAVFDWVYRYYDERRRMEGERKGSGKVLKLLLASIYGKLAQSVGCAPYSNPLWAALITSQVRATLIAGALSENSGHDVFMLATDGIFCTQPRDLPLGKELGQWDAKTHASAFVVQSGIYFIPGESPKTRGTPQSKVLAHEKDFRDAWRHILDTGEDVSVPIDVTIFVGVRLALARNKPELAGRWLDSARGDIEPKRIRFEWHTKRFAGTFRDTSLWTDPIPGGPNLESEPYSRVIGGIKAKERLEWTDAPDWAPRLL